MQRILTCNAPCALNRHFICCSHQDVAAYRLFTDCVPFTSYQQVTYLVASCIQVIYNSNIRPSLTPNPSVPQGIINCTFVRTNVN